MYHLIAYDIAGPRRLQRVARFMEKRAVRCQKSVFLFHGETDDVDRLLDEVTPLLNLAEDVVQAWKISKDQPSKGRYRGAPWAVTPAGMVLAPGRTMVVEQQKTDSQRGSEGR